MQTHESWPFPPQNPSANGPQGGLECQTEALECPENENRDQAQSQRPERDMHHKEHQGKEDPSVKNEKTRYPLTVAPMIFHGTPRLHNRRYGILNRFNRPAHNRRKKKAHAIYGDSKGS